jgi:hypothetical protein
MKCVPISFKMEGMLSFKILMDQWCDWNYRYDDDVVLVVYIYIYVCVCVLCVYEWLESSVLGVGRPLYFYWIHQIGNPSSLDYIICFCWCDVWGIVFGVGFNYYYRVIVDRVLLLLKQ